MGYQVFLRPATVRDLRKLPQPMNERIEAAIGELAANARPRGSKKLVGHEDEWRLRVGDYRVLYVIDEGERQVTVARVAHRREAYR